MRSLFALGLLGMSPAAHAGVPDDGSFFVVEVTYDWTVDDEATSNLHTSLVAEAPATKNVLAFSTETDRIDSTSSAIAPPRLSEPRIAVRS